MKSGKTTRILSCGALAACVLLTSAAYAAEDEDAAPAPPPAPKRMGPVSGNPVNVAVSGGGQINKGNLLVQPNFSFRRKTHIENDNGRGRYQTQLVSLFKLRYGITDNWEVLFVPGYVHVHNDSFLGQDNGFNLAGWNDFRLALNWGPWQQKQGDPISVCFTFGVNLPTGQRGTSHPPGFNAWAYNGAIGITKVWPQDGHRIDAAVGFTQVMEAGNVNPAGAEVRRGTQYTFTGSYHYIFNPYFDVGLEFALENNQDGKVNGNKADNGSTEMYIGPAVNFNFPEQKMWMGLGVYFPLIREYDAPNTASENFRVELKLGALFSL